MVAGDGENHYAGRHQDCRGDTTGGEALLESNGANHRAENYAALAQGGDRRQRQNLGGGEIGQVARHRQDAGEKTGDAVRSNKGSDRGPAPRYSKGEQAETGHYLEPRLEAEHVS